MLNNVLSALKDLILNTETFSDSYELRLQDYRSKFPTLSAPEIEDLAKIEPEKIKIYTGTIFAGERSVLANHFPITFEVLRTFYPEVYKKRFNSFTFVKELHRKQPWKSNSTEALADNLLSFITKNFPEFTAKVPELLEIATAEYHMLLVARTPQSNKQGTFSDDTTKLNSLRVEEFLESQFFIPQSVYFQKCAYPILDVRAHFYSNGHVLPLTLPLKEKETFAVCARNTEHRTRWNELSPQVFNLLSSTPRETDKEVSSIAEVFLKSIEKEDTSEIEKLNQFLSFTFTLHKQGIITL